ncbi:MAG TPA: hypothetical protein VJN96_04220 [Vicinamibacterales bacterium]|nr:hypothetical protein [Vicinamibacterales bacterium]
MILAPSDIATILDSVDEARPNWLRDTVRMLCVSHEELRLDRATPAWFPRLRTGQRARADWLLRELRLLKLSLNERIEDVEPALTAGTRSSAETLIEADGAYE